jgi:hypothetical protein
MRILHKYKVTRGNQALVVKKNTIAVNGKGLPSPLVRASGEIVIALTLAPEMFRGSSSTQVNYPKRSSDSLTSLSI